MRSLSDIGWVVVFDLDDTLYKEVDYLRSGYRSIADQLMSEYGIVEDPYPMMLRCFDRGADTYVCLNERYGLDVPKEVYLRLYRTHVPVLSLSAEVREVLCRLRRRGCVLGIVTDGRSVTQRNKIRALGLSHYIAWDDIIISEEFGSEKTEMRNFACYRDKYAARRFMYVGDNPEKDFLVPNRLGWVTACLLGDEYNIHRQDFNLPQEYLPTWQIEKLSEIFKILER